MADVRRQKTDAGCQKTDIRQGNGRAGCLSSSISKKLPFFFLVSIFFLAGCRTEKQPDSQNRHPHQKHFSPYVVIKNETLFVEIAITPEARSRGLMFRDSLPETHGMLFIFESEATHPFWMKNTTIPLSIAFINSKNIIVDVQDMQPLSTNGHSSRFPCLYALEANQNWFSTHHIRIGDNVLMYF
jgi:uncharacterized membrane protein (UPF0127 family)